jgi:hypothetical protein
VNAASVTPPAIRLWMTQGWLRMSPGVRLQGGPGGANKDSPVASLSRLRPRAAVWLSWLLTQALLQGHSLGSSSVHPLAPLRGSVGFPNDPKRAADIFRA